MNQPVKINAALVVLSTCLVLMSCSESAPTESTIESEKRPVDLSEVIFSVSYGGVHAAFRTYQAPLSTAIPIRQIASESAAVSRPTVGDQTGLLYFRDHSQSTPPGVHRLNMETGKEGRLYSKNFEYLPTDAGDMLFEVSPARIWLLKPGLQHVRFDPSAVLWEYSLTDSLITQVGESTPVVAGYAADGRIVAIDAKRGGTRLMYMTASAELVESRDLTSMLGTFNSSPATVLGADLSTDQQKVLFDVQFRSDPRESGVFVLDLSTLDLTRLTTAPDNQTDALPHWGPNGSVYFLRTAPGSGSEVAGDLMRLDLELGEASILVGANRFPGSTGIESFDILLK